MPKNADYVFELHLQLWRLWSPNCQRNWPFSSLDCRLRQMWLGPSIHHAHQLWWRGLMIAQARGKAELIRLLFVDPEF